MSDPSRIAQVINYPRFRDRLALQQVGARIEWTRNDSARPPKRSALVMIGADGELDDDAILAQLDRLVDETSTTFRP